MSSKNYVKEIEKEVNNEEEINYSDITEALKQQYLNNYDNKEIEKSISSYLTIATIFEIAIIIISIICFIVCLGNEVSTGLSFLILILGIAIALLLSMTIKWFGYTLKCLYNIKCKLDDNFKK